MPPAARIGVAERRVEVLRRRSRGDSYAQIAADLAPVAGPRYQARHAHEDAKRALEAVRDELADMARLHMALELVRLDEYQRETEEVLEQAKADGDGNLRLRAVDRLVVIQKRRDDMLGITRVTVEATKVTESGGERPHAEDSTDEVARKRAARRLAARG